MKKFFYLILCLTCILLLVSCKSNHTDEDEAKLIEEKGTELINKYLEDNVERYTFIENCRMCPDATYEDGTHEDNIPSRVVQAKIDVYAGKSCMIYADTATGKIYTDYLLNDEALVKEVTNKVFVEPKSAELCEYLNKYISNDQIKLYEVEYKTDYSHVLLESLDLYDPHDKKNINTYVSLYGVLPGEIASKEKFEDYLSKFKVSTLYFAYASDEAECFPKEMFEELKNNGFKYNIEMVRISGDELENLNNNILFVNEEREQYLYDCTNGTYILKNDYYLCK